MMARARAASSSAASASAAAAASAASAASFFECVRDLPGAPVQHLRDEEKSFMCKHAALAREFKSAKHDPRPTVVLLLLLQQRFPSGVAREIVEFVGSALLRPPGRSGAL